MKRNPFTTCEIIAMVCSRLSVLLLLISSSLYSASVIKQSNHLGNLEVNLPEKESLEPPRTIMDYMLQLRNDLTDSEGKPKLANIEDPTEVWALQDTGILQGRYRRKARAEEQCISTNQFLFNLESMASHTKKQLPVEKSILRVYMKFNSWLLETQEPTMLTIEVYMKLLETNGSEKVLASVNNMPVTAQFSQWVEFNVTDAIRMFWPPTAEDTDLEVTDLEVTLILKMDCQLNMRLPAIIINPATVPLNKVARRKKKLLLQPFLVVHLSDETIKDIVRNESIGTFNEGDLGLVSIHNENITNNETRKKRYSSTFGCHIEDFFVNFELIEIRYIEAPRGYNAKQCKGSCGHDFLSLNGRFGNNHAKIMAGARKLHEISSGQFNTEPKGPCCVPIRYSSITVIEMDEALKYTVYPSMKVEDCGCR